jgi:hypothetical protein
MEKNEEYRHRAEECQKLAENAPTPSFGRPIAN